MSPLLPPHPRPVPFSVFRLGGTARFRVLNRFSACCSGRGGRPSPAAVARPAVYRYNIIISALDTLVVRDATFLRLRQRNNRSRGLFFFRFGFGVAIRPCSVREPYTATGAVQSDRPTIKVRVGRVLRSEIFVSVRSAPDSVPLGRQSTHGSSPKTSK